MLKKTSSDDHMFLQFVQLLYHQIFAQSLLLCFCVLPVGNKAFDEFVMSLMNPTCKEEAMICKHCW